MYDNSRDSPENKTEQILHLLENMQSMDESRLENFCRELEHNRELILENHAYLRQVSHDTSEIIDRLDEAKSERQTLAHGFQRMENKIDEFV